MGNKVIYFKINSIYEIFNYYFQARVASKGAIAVLLKRLIRHSTRDTEDDLQCIEMVCNALASLMLYKSNQEQLFGRKAIFFYLNDYSNFNMLFLVVVMFRNWWFRRSYAHW